VTVDYYSDAVGSFMDGADYPYGDFSDPARLYLPPLNFVKKETWGYSTNGQQFLIAQGDSYAGIADSFEGTIAEILDGSNSSTSTDYTPVVIRDGTQVSGPRPLFKTVDTGWMAKPAGDKQILSNILSLWGMGELDMDGTDVFVLEMSYVK
jgi:hypothetical protein